MKNDFIFNSWCLSYYYFSSDMTLFFNQKDMSLFFLSERHDPIWRNIWSLSKGLWFPWFRKKFVLTHMWCMNERCNNQWAMNSLINLTLNLLFIESVITPRWTEICLWEVIINSIQLPASIRKRTNLFFPFQFHF